MTSLVPKPTIRRVISAALALFCGVVLGLLGTGGTYAFLNAQTTVSAGTITAGSLNLAIVDVTQLGADASALLPGQSTYLAFRMTNDGTVASSITGTTRFNLNTAFTDDLSLSFTKAAASRACPRILTYSPLSTPIHMSAGETSTVCLRISLSDIAAQPAAAVSSTFVLSLTSVQKVN